MVIECNKGRNEEEVKTSSVTVNADIQPHRNNKFIEEHNKVNPSNTSKLRTGNTYQPQPRSTENNIMNIATSKSVGVEPPTKRIKLEKTSATSQGGGSYSVVTAGSSPQHTSQSSNTSNSSHDSLIENATVTPYVAVTRIQTAAVTITAPKEGTRLLSAIPTATTIATTTKATAAVAPSKPPTSTRSRVVSSTSSPIPQSLSVSSVSAGPTKISNINASSAAVLQKALNFGHLRMKYLGELEYMLREFRKLERQLLGAKGAAQLEESAGSRERREKLHSFILHLEDTIRQIELGCKLEDENKSTTVGSNNVSTNNKGSMDINGTNTNIQATSGRGCSSAHNGASVEGANNISSNDGIVEAKEQQLAEESTLSNLTKEKEEEDIVQKLEEHILANLLPVKVRLKKQLAAQQGATQNPAGMPSLRRGSLQQPTTARGKGTFAEAAEKRRKEAETARLAAQEQRERAVWNVSDPTQFGKPLSGGGSSLTQKLHGPTLGSTQRRNGSGVGSSSTPEVVVDDNINNISGVAGVGVDRKILYAGMVPLSTQQKSGLSAASGAHEMVLTSNQNNKTSNNNSGSAPTITSVPDPTTVSQVSKDIFSVATPVAQTSHVCTKTIETITVEPKRSNDPKVTNVEAKIATEVTTATPSIAAKKSKSAISSTSAPSSEEEKLKFKKNRRKRKLLRLARRRERERLKQQNPKSQQITNTQQAPSNSSTTVERKKVVHHHSKGLKKKGPRVVEYICSLCSEAYSSTCELNPWWALAQHKCPKCQKTQIPRIDITSPANIIEYHPALLSHLEDGGRGGNAGSIHVNTAQAAASATMHIVSQIPGTGARKTSTVPNLDSESDSDLSELSDDDISIGSLKAAEMEADIQSMTPAERAEHEIFGNEYEGPRLSDEHAAKMLILMSHASTCPCHHKSEKHKDVCRSTKYMMLHVRDCPGTTSTFDVCPFPWCRKIKHLLYHLVSCTEPDQCPICSPKDLPNGLKALIGLNTHRMKDHRDHMVATALATLKASRTKANPVTKPLSVNRNVSATQTNHLRKVISGASLSTAQALAVQEATSANSKRECVPAQVTSQPSNVTATTTIGTGVNDSSRVQNPATSTQAHLLTLQDTVSNEPTMSQEDFDINAEIAKLDEQLNPGPIEELFVASVEDFVSQSTTSTVKIEANSITTAVAQTLAGDSSDVRTRDGTNVSSDRFGITNMNDSTDSTNCPNSSDTTTTYENNNNAEISAEDEQVLPTPISAIKMEDNDADAAEISDLLAPSETALTNFKTDPNFLDTSDAITASNFGMGIGTDACSFPDTITNNNNILVLASNAPSALIATASAPTNTYMTLNEDHSGPVSTESTPNVATVTAAAVVAAAATAEVNTENTNTSRRVKVN